MPRMTGGEAIVRSLVAEGVKAIFGIPGTQGLALFDALNDAPQIQRITPRHEQGAAYMADGYARASGEIGVCTVPTGPGALNTLAAMGTAYTDSVPVLNIFSQIPTPYIGRGKGYLHELRDQLGMFSEVTGWRARAENVASIPWLVHEAMARLRSGRPRPAALEVPLDVLDAAGDASIPLPAPRLRQAGAREQVEATAGALLRARRPLIWAGGGVISSGGSAELIRLAEALQAPVYTTVNGRGAIPGDHPLSLGYLPLRNFVQEYVSDADLILAVGARFSAPDTAQFALKLPANLFHIDVDPAEIGKNYPVAGSVVGDAKTVLSQLCELVEPSAGQRPSRAAEADDLKSRVCADLEARSMDAVRLANQIRGAVGRDGIIVNDVTILSYWGRTLFDVYEPRTYMYPWGFVTLGFGLPAAIGAKVARPDRKVVAICGDGGFLYTSMELATAMQLGLNVVALVINDDQFGILAPQQMKRFGRTTMIDLHNPDFVAMARSFGAYGERIGSIDEVGSALEEALAVEGPAVLELKIKLHHPFDW